MDRLLPTVQRSTVVILVGVVLLLLPEPVTSVIGLLVIVAGAADRLL